MKINRQIGLVVLIALIGSVMGFFILQMEKEKVADAHDHGGHEEGAEGHGEHDEHEGHGGHGEEEGHAGHGKRVEFDAEGIRVSGIVLDTVKAGTIRKSLPLNGLVQANQDKVARMMPRFPGVVKEVRHHLGNKVAKGQVLAVIESNESLAPYQVVSQMSGTVVQKNVNPGEVVDEKDLLYTVADLSTVWIDLNVHRQDFNRLKVGQEVLVKMDKESPAVKSRISYLSPIGAENTQTMLARIVVPNPSGLWRPGLYVDGYVTLTTEEVPMAISENAIQTLDGKEVVFVLEENAFEAREVELGARDGEWAEVLSGVGPDDVYASENSFIIKAEIGKGEAKHEH
jgi:membrane fusion protein, heavy metal efflux system